MYTPTHNHMMYMYMGKAKVCRHIHTTIGWTCTWARLRYVHTYYNHRMYMSKAKVCTHTHTHLSNVKVNNISLKRSRPTPIVNC